MITKSKQMFKYYKIKESSYILIWLRNCVLVYELIASLFANRLLKFFCLSEPIATNHFQLKIDMRCLFSY